MNDFNRQHIDLEDEEPVQITDLDPADSPQRRRAERVSALLRRSVATPWIRFGLIGALLLALLSAIVVQQHELRPAPTTPNINASPTAFVSSKQPNGAFFGQQLYVQSADHTVRALQAGSGRVLWQTKLAGAAAMQADGQALYCYFPIISSNQNRLEALSASDGRVLWQIVMAMPATRLQNADLLPGGDTLYVTGADGAIYALSTSKGYLRWWYQVGHEAGPLSSFVQARNGVAEIRSSDGTIHVLNVSDGREILHLSSYSSLPPMDARFIYALPTPGNPASDQRIQVYRVADGRLAWSFALPGGAATLSEQNGVIYQSNIAGSVVNALRGSDGQLLWSYSTSDGVGLAGGPFVINNVTYLLQQDTTLVAIRVSDGRLLWRVHIAALDALAGHVQPMFDGGTILLADQSSDSSSTTPVYALDAHSGTILWRAVEPAGNIEPLGGILYVAQKNGQLDAWRDRDNVHLWRVQVYGSSIFVGALPAVPNVVLVIVDQDTHLLALRTSDGRLLWNY